MKEPKKFSQGLIDFFKKRLWEYELQQISIVKAFFVYLLRLLSLVIGGVIKNKSIVRATALAYTTLLSLVPFLAVVFFVFNAFGGLNKLEQRLKPIIMENLATGTGERVYNYIRHFVDNVHSGTIGALGIVFLIITVIMLLMTVEDALNDVWGVKKKRSLFRKFTAYWSILTIGPLLLALSSTITASLQSAVVVKKILEISLVAKSAAIFLPYLLSWIAFTILYLFMPNTKVHFRSAFIGGIVAGSMWELAKWGYTLYATQVVSYSKIYGSLGAIPIFLIWIYLAWIIVLIGAEISFADQNMKTYKEERQISSISFALKEAIALRIVYLIGRAFLIEQKFLSLKEINTKIQMPTRVINQVIFELCESEIIREIGDEGEFAPAKPLEQISPASIIEALKRIGFYQKVIPPSPVLDSIAASFNDALAKVGKKDFRELILEAKK